MTHTHEAHTWNIPNETFNIILSCLVNQGPTGHYFLPSQYALCQSPCTRHSGFNFSPSIVLPFPSQMGGASSYSTQFLSHSSPRGPPPGMVSSRPGPPPTSGGLYPSHPAQTQKMSQHGGYPGGQQGLKRPFHSEVSLGGWSPVDVFWHIKNAESLFISWYQIIPLH